MITPNSNLNLTPSGFLLNFFSLSVRLVLDIGPSHQFWFVFLSEESSSLFLVSGSFFLYNFMICILDVTGHIYCGIKCN